MKYATRLAALALAGAAVLMVVGSASGSSKFVGCGSDVTSNLTLVADLNCSLGGTNGLEVDANGITINLNGHSIIGAGGADGYTGIDMNSRSDVTIKNGTITNFEIGIYTGGANRPTIQKMNIVLDGDFSNATDLIGIDADVTYQAKISQVNVTSPAQQDGTETYFAYGLYLYRTTQSKIDHSMVTGARYGFYDFEGGYYCCGGGSVYIDDTANLNGSGFWLVSNENGSISLLKSTASSNTNEGVYLHDAPGSTVKGNTFANNGGDGIHGAFNAFSVISKNSSHNNGGNGFNFWDAYQATLTKNTATENNRDGVRLGDFIGAVVTGNTSNNNGGNGFNMFSNVTCFGLFAKNQAFGNDNWSGYASNFFIPGTGNKGDGGFNNVNVAKFCI